MRGEPALSERLADDIVGIIRDERLVPGDTLASSRELARRLSVTTPTVREALRRLEATGAVELRHGSGTYVGPGIGRRLLANPHGVVVTRDAVRELVEARLVLEPSIAEAAARARDPEGLAQMETALGNALVPQVGDARPAVHFHVALAATSGNVMLRESVESLLEVRVQEQVAVRHRYDDRERDHAEHQRILSAVRDGDAAAARAVTAEHLGSILAVVTAGGDAS